VGFEAVAVNLHTDQLWNKDHLAWMEAKIKEIEGKVVIVAPSMSGRGAVPYVLKHPEVFGFIPIAPAIDPRDLPKDNSVSVRTLVMYGQYDGPGKAVSEHLLKVFKDPVKVEIAGAGHSCYLDDPDTWHKALQTFLKSL
jgi:abhydrolase domain-containing protein 14